MPGTEQTLKKFSREEEEEEDDEGRKKSHGFLPVPHITGYLLYVKYYFELFFDSKNMYRITYV